MKEYRSLDKLKNDWFTITDLQEALEEKNLPKDRLTILRWERLGKIPRPTYVKFRGYPWRVYTKEDIEKIIELAIAYKRSYYAGFYE